MHILQLCEQIFGGNRLEDKLASATQIQFGPRPSSLLLPNSLVLLTNPGREKSLQFSPLKTPFPKSQDFAHTRKRAEALHFFANHELLAIEIMAATLLKFPDLESSIQQGIYKTIQDEQKHFKLYLMRMNELGLEFGELPLNGFFWRFFKDITSPAHYFAIMSLTFEGANLDFAWHYSQLMAQYQDIQTQKLLQEVLADEITHVSAGRHFLSSQPDLSKYQNSLWEYYQSLLCLPLSARHSKGKFFRPQLRLECGFDVDFVEKLNQVDKKFVPLRERGELKSELK